MKSHKNDPGQTAIVEYTVMIAAVARDLQAFALSAVRGADGFDGCSSIGARALQLLAVEFKGLFSECECGDPHDLPASFLASIDALANSSRANAEAHIAADKARGFAAPGGVS